MLRELINEWGGLAASLTAVLTLAAMTVMYIRRKIARVVADEVRPTLAEIRTEIAVIRAELSPNRGRSMRDAIGRMEAKQDRIEAKQDQLAEQLVEHLRDHFT